MKIAGKVRAWYVEYKEYRRVKRLERVKKLAKRRSREEVQIMEYKGELYICYRGVPIVSESDLAVDWSDVLALIRGTYEVWLVEREMEK